MHPIHWQTFEYHYEKKSADWYWVFTMIVLTSAAIFSVLGNWLMALIIFIGGACLLFLSRIEPGVVDITVNDDGIYIGENFFPYEMLQGFFIHPRKRHSHLLFKTRDDIPEIQSALHYYIIDPEIDLEELYILLAENAAEEPMHEPLQNRLFESIGL